MLSQHLTPVGGGSGIGRESEEYNKPESGEEMGSEDRRERGADI